jgi:hypothetical protein
MRMNSEQVELSIKVIRKYFADAAVWLFGSRVDDSRKGGDFVFILRPPSRTSPCRWRGRAGN